MADPLSSTYVHSALVAVLLLFLLCVLVRLVVRSPLAREARHALEVGLLDCIPRYRPAKAFAADGPLNGQGGLSLRPVLASIQEGLSPTLLMDEFADGRLLVFIPGSPAPGSGAIPILTSHEVELFDMSPLLFPRSIASGGLELRETTGAEAPRARVSLSSPAPA